MLRSIGKNWWVPVVQGVAAVLFGLGTLAWPGLTLGFLIALFGAYALVDGVAALVAMFQTGGQETPWWVWLLLGVSGIGAGIAAFAWPGMTALLLVYVIAARALLSGIAEIFGALALRKEIEGEWLMVAGGALSVIFGLWLFAAPAAGALALTLTIGLFSIVIGGMLIALGFHVRDLRKRLQTFAEARAT